MKRNDIYKELIEIRNQLRTYLAEDSPINQLIDTINQGNQLHYNQFDCMADVIQRFEKVKDQMYAIERETEWIKDGKFHKPWNNR